MKKEIKCISLFSIIVLVLIIALFSGTASAAIPGRVISNSEDWKDVYSVMLFSSLNGYTGSFLVSEKHSTIILGNIPKDTHLWVVSSQRTPYILGYKSLIESKGYTVEEFIYSNVNLELGKQLDKVTNFVILDDSYGYNSISVAPYATASKSWVLFADRNNIDDIVDFLNSRTVDSLLIYGHVDREVTDGLSIFDPETINHDGDRFLNNLDIVDRYRKIADAKQVILTNGEFIEREIMSGVEPVVFIGSGNVPDNVRQYIQDSNIEVGVLIGNELVSSATFIRRQIGISVFVKFAQGARQPGAPISQVEALDMFYLPTYNLNLDLDSAKYNKATNQLEITLRNTVEQGIYFKGTHSIDAADGTNQRVGDIDTVFIEANSLKTMVYDIEPLPEGQSFVDIYIVYGESRNALERVIQGKLPIEEISVLDNCDISLNSLMYNKNAKVFYIDTENKGEVPCFVNEEIIDIRIGGEKQNLGQEGVESIDVGESKKIKIIADLSDSDIEDNSKVNVRAHYGERKNALVKVKEQEFDMMLTTLIFGMTPSDLFFYSLLLVIIFLITLIIYKRRKKAKQYGF